MFELFFKEILVDAFMYLLEDFTEQDIQVDSWRGTVIKENAVFKKTALEGLSASLGAPIVVQAGYIGKIEINVPWNEIMTKPVVCRIDDVHIVCDTPPQYDPAFAERILHSLKKKKFEKLFQQFKEQQEKQMQEKLEAEAMGAEEELKKQKEKQESFTSRLRKIIVENLRITVHGLHLRFEDKCVSRVDRAFNVGLTIEQLVWSSTNSRFERAFINIDDKKREMRSFKMLEIKQFALYWNSNIHENWTKNSEFMNLDCQQMIEFSKQYVDNLTRRYQQFKKNNAASQVYLIEPFDFTLKMRSNLNQAAQPSVPLTTLNLDISQLLFTVDEEVYKDAQYLSKLWSWHSSAVHKDLSHFKFRPAYTVPVRGNARWYWRYAIKSTIFYLRRQQRQQRGELKAAQSRYMIELSELYKLREYNLWVKRTYSDKVQKDHLILDYTVQLDEPVTVKLPSFEAMEAKITRMESELSAEQMVVAFSKAEKDAKQLIDEDKKKSGWTSWMTSSMMSFMGYRAQNPQGKSSEQAQTSYEESESRINEIMEKLEDFEKLESQASTTAASRSDYFGGGRQNKARMLSSHVCLSVPIIQLAVVNKSLNHYGSKQFLTIVVERLFVQYLSSQAESLSQTLLSIEKFEINDSLLNQQKFQSMIQKKEQQSEQARDRNYQMMPATARLQQYQQRGRDDSLSEIDEETDPNINNGMTIVQEYESLKNGLEVNQTYFLVFQFTTRQIVKSTAGLPGEQRQSAANPELLGVKQRSVDLVVTSLQLFYNKNLMKRTQSFINQARINRVHNAQAEADFEDKVDKMKRDAQKQMQKELMRSEMIFNCSLKSIDVLVPDHINYEVSKFIILQTREIQLRSGDSKRLGLYYRPNHQIDKQLRHQINRDLKELRSQGEAQAQLAGEAARETEMDGIEYDGAEPELVDKHALLVYDLQVLYIPAVDILEQFLFNEARQQQIDKQHAILKKMDIVIESHSGQLDIRKSSGRSSAPDAPKDAAADLLMHQHVKVGIGVIDIKISNKEMQELKDYIDNIVRYHDEIEFELKRELAMIRATVAHSSRHNYDGQGLFGSSLYPLHYIGSLTEERGADDIGVSSLLFKSQASMADIAVKIMKQKTTALNSSMTLSSRRVQRRDSTASFQSLRNDEEFEDFEVNEDEEQRSEQEGEDDSTLKFEDAHDYFEPDVVNQIAKLAGDDQQSADEAVADSQAKNKPAKVKKKRALVLSVCMPKVKLQVLESQEESLEKELREIRQRIGAASLSRLDIKFKGSPFLELELNKIDVRVMDQPSISAKGLFIKDIMLSNVEKRGEPKLIFSSCGNDLFTTFEGSQPLSELLKDQYASASFAHLSVDDSMSRPYDSNKTNRGADAKHGSYWLSKAQLLGPEEEDQPMQERFMHEYEDAEETRISGFLEFFQTRTELADKVQVQVGHVNVELTDSTLRKVYESIIQQMPETQVSQYRQQRHASDSSQVKHSSSSPPSKDSAMKEIDFRCQSVSTVLKDKKDFILLKLFGIQFNLLQEPNIETTLRQFKIADFQVIQDENDLLLKHYSGMQPTAVDADLWSKAILRFARPEHQNQEQQVPSPFDDPNDGQEEQLTYLIKFTELKDMRERLSEKELTITNFLFIIDFKCLIKVRQIQKSFENQMRSILADMKSRHTSRRSQSAIQDSVQGGQLKGEEDPEKGLHSTISCKLLDSFVQLPAREGQNSLFFVVENLELLHEKDENKIQKIKIQDQLLQIFVAQQFDQTERYNLLSVINTELNGLHRSFDVHVSEIKLTLNENYVWLLSKLVDENILDIETLLQKTKSKDDAKDKSPPATSSEEKLQPGKVIMDDESAEEMRERREGPVNGAGLKRQKFFFELLFEKDLQAIEHVLLLNNVDPLDLEKLARSGVSPEKASVQNIAVDSFKLEWIFGQSFDDYQEKFVTLKNRNVSNLILERFDTEYQNREANDVADNESERNNGSLENEPDEKSNNDLEVSPADFNQIDSSSKQQMNKGQNKQLNMIKSWHSMGGLQPLDALQNTRNQKIQIELRHITVQQMTAYYPQPEVDTGAEKLYSRLFKVNQLAVDIINQNSYKFSILQVRAAPSAVGHFKTGQARLPANEDGLKSQRGLAIEFLLGDDVVLRLGHADLKVCQMNAQVISNLTKSIYTSKNVVFKGRRRHLIAQMLAPNKEEQQKPAREAETNKVLRVDVSNFRIIIFDSGKFEQECRPQYARTQSDISLPFDDDHNAQAFAERVQKQSRAQQQLSNRDRGAEHLNDDLVDEVIREENFENEEGQLMLSHRTEDKQDEDDHGGATAMYNVVDAEQQKFFDQQFSKQVLSADSVPSKSAFIINLKIHFVKTRNPTWITNHFEKDIQEKGLNKMTLIKFQDIELYQNTFPTTLRELTEVSQAAEEGRGTLDSSQLAKEQLRKTIMLHPTNVLIKQGHFVQKPGYPLKVWEGIDVSTCELELSVKQLFKLKMIQEKILDRVQPILQILEHQKKKNERSNDKKGSKSASRTRGREEGLASQQAVTHSKRRLDLDSLYLTVVNEIGDSSMLLMSASEQSPLKMSSQFAPVLSFESRDIQMVKLKHSDQSEDCLELQVPFEVYYFNQSLNFYEPFIEKTQLNLSLRKDAKSQTNIKKIEMKKLLNINFSVAFYDAIFCLKSTFNQEKMIFDQLKASYQQEMKQNESQQSGMRKRERQKPSIALAKKKFESSSYFIKNSTGEVLRFKTLNQKTFLELQPDEEYPLDFQLMKNFEKSKPRRDRLQSEPESESALLQIKEKSKGHEVQSVGQIDQMKALKSLRLSKRRRKLMQVRTILEEFLQMQSNKADYRQTHQQATDEEDYYDQAPSDESDSSLTDDDHKSSNDEMMELDETNLDEFRDMVADLDRGQKESTLDLGNQKHQMLEQLKNYYQVELADDGAFKPQQIQSRSIFRRRNYKFLKSEPKKVLFQILIQYGSDIRSTTVFEVNIESLQCQRIFLDDKKEFYVICQTQQADGKKHLIVRSPMQICNNLQIPLEMMLLNKGDSLEGQRFSEPSSLFEYAQVSNSDASARYLARRGLNRMGSDQQIHGSMISTDYNLRHHAMQFKMIVEPQTSTVIPLRACGFRQVQMRPIFVPIKDGNADINYGRPLDSRSGDKKFEWTVEANVSLLKEEQEIFEQQSIILESKMLRKNTGFEQNNNKVFLVLNSNTYSIRSYVDFNTQQTEFISMRYLSISPPFVFQNLIPVPITMFFRNILRKVDHTGSLNINKEKMDGSRQQIWKADPRVYDLQLKYNSELQVLFLNPLGNFDFSMLIPGYNESNQLTLKQEGDEDMQICEDIRQQNFLNAIFTDQENQSISQPRGEARLDEVEQARPSSLGIDEVENQNFKQKNKFRFIQQKYMLFQLVSQYQNQFNVCTNVAFVQGQYHLTFYSKYWLLNNTFMPLEVQIKTQQQKFEIMNLPFEAQDFDFETYKSFAGNGTAGKSGDGKDKGADDKTAIGNQVRRKNSEETLITQLHGDDGKLKQSGATTHQMSLHSASGYSLKKGMAEQINYRHMIKVQQEQANERSQFGRIKPWESYKFQQQDSAGLLGLLSQQEVDSVGVVYFTQEDYREEAKSDFDGGEGNEKLKDRGGHGRQSSEFQSFNDRISQATSQNEQRYLQGLRRSSANLRNIDSQSMMSKTSIQLTDYQMRVESQNTVPLLHTELSRAHIYPSPLQDHSQLKRVFLFSDSPIDDQLDFSKMKQRQEEPLKGQEGKAAEYGARRRSGQLDAFSEDTKYIGMKICDSDWTDVPFDITKLQGESILLQDQSRKYCTNSMYELVANVQYLPNPFSFSKIIEFKSRYMVCNRTSQPIQIIQSGCEEKGMFKVYPSETSNFHWTDSAKPHAINVKFEDHEYSGNIRIDGIGEMTLRLRGTFDNESAILNVSITEQGRTFTVHFTDVSYAPPYRIENLTKTTFKISQRNSRTNDFDILRPYMIIPYAWSYPLHEKLLNISVSSSSSDQNLGSFTIDQINKSEKIVLEDKQSGSQFLLEILNEETLKVVRISYTDEFTQSELIGNKHSDKLESQTKSRLQVHLRKVGFSVINSQARELAYAHIRNLKFSSEKHYMHREICLKVQDIQLDNQIVRRDDEIIIRRDDQRVEAPDFLTDTPIDTSYFLSLKFNYLQNDDEMQNLYFFKYFILIVTPFSLTLDGNFCDEMFKYFADIQQRQRKYHAYEQSKKSELYESEIDKIKIAFNELKKPYYDPSQGRDAQAQKKIYFEEFYVHSLKLKFTFKSSPIMFRELALNSTLKFLVVVMSNLKKVQLSFNRFHIQQQQQLMPIFYAQLKKHYIQQCYNHQQILALISSMGLFGNISESLSNLSNAIEQLVYHPLHDENLVKGMAVGGALFLRQSISAVTGPIKAVLESVSSGLHFFISEYMARRHRAARALQDGEEDVYLPGAAGGHHGRNLFDEDIEQITRDLHNFGTPMNAIAVDTQNRIWLKIIFRECELQDLNRQQLMKVQRRAQPMRSDLRHQRLIQIEDQPERSGDQDSGVENGLDAEDAKSDIYKEDANLSLDYFSTRQQKRGGLFESTQQFFSQLTSLKSSLAHRLDGLDTRQQFRTQARRVRQPRFTSFTMQLEPYNKKKADALKTLNDINMNVVQSESIQKLFEMDRYVFIFTAKRIICVEEQMNRKQATPLRQQWRPALPRQAQHQQSNPEAVDTFVDERLLRDNKYRLDVGPRRPGKHGKDTSLLDSFPEEDSDPDNTEHDLDSDDPSRQAILGTPHQAGTRTSTTNYNHWNIQYDNILKLRFEALVRDEAAEVDGGEKSKGLREVTEEEWKELFGEKQERVGPEVRAKQNGIMVRAKILYSQSTEEENEGKAGRAYENGGRILSRVGGPGHERHNVHQHQSRDQGINQSDFSDLRVDCKEVLIGRKDLEQLSRVCKEIYKRSKQHLM